MSKLIHDALEPAGAGGAVLSPAMMEEIRQDPSKFADVARAFGIVNMDNLFRAMQDPRVGLQHRLEFQKMLNKLAGLEPASAAPAGPGVIINITRAAARGDGAITIEGKADDPG